MPPETLLRVTARGSTVLAVGDNGNILRSTDGGASWNRVRPGNSERLVDVSLNGNGRAVAVAENTTKIWVSTDGGASWSPVANGGVFSGATTGTLTITGAPVTLNGNKFRAVLSVAACTNSVTTDAVTLTVNANPSISLSAAPFTSLYPGLQTTLTANASPASTGNTFVWTLNGATLSGVTGSSNIIDIDGLGEYTATVTDQNGCRSSASNSVVITDSLNTTLFIYPNPNNGVFQVRYYDKENGVSNPRVMNIYDSKGARVYRKAFTPAFSFGRMDVDLTRFGKGVYYVELNDAAGARLAAERVVVF